MSAAAAAAGILLVAIALVDLAWTTVGAGSGAGPLTARIASALWHAALAVHRRRPSHSFLSSAGVIVVFAVLAVWIVLALAGWSLVFAASEGAVRATDSGRAADFVERLYFTGYTVLTLGNGDFRPGHGVWQLATVAATGTGLIIVTLSITYVVPVAAAAASRRQLASYISTLGATPEEIVANGWNGSSFSDVSQHLVALTPLVLASRQQHLTYPVLHYIHSQDRESAAAPNIANLSQALHLFRHGVRPGHRPSSPVLEPLEQAVDSFLATLHGAHLRPTTPIPAPDLDAVRATGISVVDADSYERADAGAERRALLGGLLANGGWPTPFSSGGRPG